MNSRLGDPALAATLTAGLALPLVVAPMFLVSGPDLVIASCRAGVIGALPSLNARTTAVFDEWLTRIRAELSDAAVAPPPAPYAVNLIVHPTNPRLEADLDVCVKHRAPLIVAAVGNPTGVIAKVRAYGGRVISDAASVKHARRAAEAGVDGLILLCAGAGGNTGWLNPFAFVAEVRRFFAGPIVLAGAISRGSYVHVAREMGADLALSGTSFIAARESLVVDAYRQMLIESNADDIVLSAEVTGIPANFLKKSLAGFTGRAEKGGFDLDKELATLRAWRDIWAAGHGVGDVEEVLPAAALVARFRDDYRAAARLVTA
jgi:nitronate monooxygenase